ncbi:hypothetical protein LTR53_016214 [Teratosphaeriaceae sp. CCFEE 6253]|nr:hypothetical protein LTR53_016214 [Teratosphaeriaceae sp. CCFEE 6253]
MSTAPHPATLLGLPYELRAAIYNRALEDTAAPHTANNIATAATDSQTGPDNTRSTYAALQQVCTTTRRDLADHRFGPRACVTCTPAQLRRLPDHATTASLASLQRLALDLGPLDPSASSESGEGPLKAVAALLPALTHLTLVLHTASLGDAAESGVLRVAMQAARELAHVPHCRLRAVAAAAAAAPRETLRGDTRTRVAAFLVARRQRERVRVMVDCANVKLACDAAVRRAEAGKEEEEEEEEVAWLGEGAAPELGLGASSPIPPKPPAPQTLPVHLPPKTGQGDISPHDHIPDPQPPQLLPEFAIAVPALLAFVLGGRGEPERQAEARARLVAEEELVDLHLVACRCAGFADPDDAGGRDGNQGREEVDGQGLGVDAQEVGGRGQAGEVGDVASQIEGTDGVDGFGGWGGGEAEAGSGQAEGGFVGCGGGEGGWGGEEGGVFRGGNLGGVQVVEEGEGVLEEAQALLALRFVMSEVVG